MIIGSPGTFRPHPWPWDITHITYWSPSLLCEPRPWQQKHTAHCWCGSELKVLSHRSLWLGSCSCTCSSSTSLQLYAIRDAAVTAAVCIILGLGVFAHEALYKKLNPSTTWGNWIRLSGWFILHGRMKWLQRESLHTASAITPRTIHLNWQTFPSSRLDLQFTVSLFSSLGYSIPTTSPPAGWESEGESFHAAPAPALGGTSEL